LVAAGQQHGLPFIAQSAIPGRSAAIVLAHESAQLCGLLSALTAWLRSWHARTRHDVELANSHLEAWVLEPATRLLGNDAPEYLAWLRQRCQAVAGRRVALVATHNDLTMANVLVSDDGLGIVDWEAATASGTPLADFCYAAADAVAARTGYRDRLLAFTACFARDGALAHEVEQLGRQLVHEPGAADTPLDLWLHVCWLRHADNEQRRDLTGPRPFGEIVTWLASHHAQLAPWLTDTRAAP
jgi:Ser/Thr protein kinase RdoA (MazF antagonist)